MVDASGLLGQITDVSANTSWALLVSDRNHATPARINRTGVRMIVGGIGSSDRLVVEDLPVSTDLRQGDLIETSGLGGRFPVGYPVGLVSSVESTESSPYLQAHRAVRRLAQSGACFNHLTAIGGYLGTSSPKRRCE